MRRRSAYDYDTVISKANYAVYQQFLIKRKNLKIYFQMETQYI